MKRLLLLLPILLLLMACGDTEEKTEFRNESVSNINENMDFIFATESLTDIWHIEDHIFDNDDVDEDRLLRFTDRHILDEEEFGSLNEYEQGLAMKTSAIILKFFKGKYEDIELFEEDLEEYYDILKNGDSFFID